MCRVIIVVMALLLAVGALAVSLNNAAGVKYYNAGNEGVGSANGGYAVIDSVANGASYSEYEQWYLFQAQASEDVYIRRYLSDGWETAPGVFIPAGKSLIINIPYTPGTTGYQRQLVQFSTVTDTVVIVPWQK